MGKRFEVTLPKLGESIVGATIVQWLKQEGDEIKLDEPLVEVSTDKVNSEIPSPVAGILKEIVAKIDEEIEVGAPLAYIEVGATASVRATPVDKAAPEATEADVSSKEEFFSPGVLRLAHVEGISMEVLKKIEGTGEGGRVTKRDIEKHLASMKEGKTKTKICAQTSKREISHNG